MGINSFGFGGANGHCVVSEYRPAEPRIWSVPLAADAGTMVPLSARTSRMPWSKRRRDLSGERCGRTPGICYTLVWQSCSEALPFLRCGPPFAVRDSGTLVGRVGGPSSRIPFQSATAAEEDRPLVMVFTGQGTQWAGCGRELYDAQPCFPARRRCRGETLACACSDRSLRSACFNATQASNWTNVNWPNPSRSWCSARLLEMFKTWGVYPDCVVGHSSGEVAAAYACGALSLADATRLVYHRATLQQRTAGSGRMLVIGLDRPGVEDLLDTVSVIPEHERHAMSDAVEIACENSPAEYGGVRPAAGGIATDHGRAWSGAVASTS